MEVGLFLEAANSSAGGGGTGGGMGEGCSNGIFKPFCEDTSCFDLSGGSLAKTSLIISRKSDKEDFCFNRSPQKGQDY